MSLALVLLQKLLFCATAGVLIEFFFTGVASLLKGNLKATSNSYLWMPPVYGFAGLALDGIRQLLDAWPYFAKAPLYVAVFYMVEMVSGLGLRALTGAIQRRWPAIFTGGGVIPWEYAKSAWAPLGLINLKYLPYWLILALCFDPIAEFFQRVAVFLAGP